MPRPSFTADHLLAKALVSAGRLRAEQLEECLERQRALGGRVSLAEILVERGILKESELAPTVVPRGPEHDSQAATQTSVERRAPAPASGAPSKIGRYDVQGELGKGGMGVVYRAVDPGIGRPVAIKMILDPSRAGEAELERFRREAKAAGSLRHPGIVSIFETGEHEGKPYLVMSSSWERASRRSSAGGRCRPGARRRSCDRSRSRSLTRTRAGSSTGT